MTKLLLKGKPTQTAGSVPVVGAKAPAFTLVDRDLKNRSLTEFQGKKKLIATVPSLDTGTCSIMTRHFNELAKKYPQIVFITVSADLPFAQARFCKVEDMQNVLTLSTMRDQKFGRDYGLLIEEGPLAGILARSVFVLDEKDQIVYVEVVQEITEEPKYDQVLSFL